MKKTLRLYFSLLALATKALAQTPAPADLSVTGNLKIDAGGTTFAGSQYNATPTTDGAYLYGNPGNLVVKGDLSFSGSNPWILHTPNDNAQYTNVPRTTLYLAPGYAGTAAGWRWSAATEFSTNGDVLFKSTTTSLNMAVTNRMTVGDVACTTPCGGAMKINNLALAVGGHIGARGGIHVSNFGDAWPDYVFAPAYRLRPLRDVAAFVRANGHLPEVPSTAQVRAEGIELAAMSAVLLKKVEELTLYLIQVQKENAALQARVQKLEH